ncbi:MAG: nucleotidyltransferase [Acidobacteriia bacterium]|nr:nucleotidyltransferase [Terriglobia bacterium]
MPRIKKATEPPPNPASEASGVDQNDGRSQEGGPVQQQRDAGTPAISSNVHIPPDELAAFCRRWSVREMALFGSVLRDDFGPESDVDVLVQFEDEAQHTLFELDEMELELREIFRREVDLVSRRGVEASHNYLRRNSILASAQVIYGS